MNLGRGRSALLRGLRNGVGLGVALVILTSMPAAAVDLVPYQWGQEQPGPAGGEVASKTSLPVKLRLPNEAAAQTVTAVSAGASHACGVTVVGEAFCWGRNDVGQVGGSPTAGESRPTRVVGFGPSTGSLVLGVAAGSQHSCVLATFGEVHCWGRNFNGQVGDGTTAPIYSPTRVDGALKGQTVTQVVAGDFHTCALTDEGQVWCWGRNAAGQLGDGTTSLSATPTRVLGTPIGVRFTSIAAGGAHTCATGTDGSAYCWGSNSESQLGNGSTDHGYRPVKVNSKAQGSPIATVTAGRWHTCATHQDGAVTCWGSNSQGQLGDGTTDNALLPVSVVGLPTGDPAASVSAGGAHTCVTTLASRAFCWGANGVGQLGDGSTESRLTPVEVKSQVSEKSETPVFSVEAGRDFSVGLIAPTGRPGVPLEPQLEGNVLTWSPPLVAGKGSDTISQYRLSYIPAGQPKAALFATIPATATSIDLAAECPPNAVCLMDGGSLTPGTRYSWLVSAANSLGAAGAYSIAVPDMWSGPTVPAPVTPPVAPPDMATVNGLLGSVLSWSPPVFPGAGGSEVAQYSIQTRPLGDTTFTEYATIPATYTSLDLVGSCPMGGICPKRGGELQAGVTYDVWVYSIGADGARSKLAKNAVPLAFTWPG